MERGAGVFACLCARGYGNGRKARSPKLALGATCKRDCPFCRSIPVAYCARAMASTRPDSLVTETRISETPAAA